MMEEFNPKNKFHCTRLDQNITYLDCIEFLTVNKLDQCIYTKCFTGTDIKEKYDKYKSKPKTFSNKTKKKADKLSAKEKTEHIDKTAENTEPKKQCSKCREYKPMDQFYKNRTTLDGLQYSCKDCGKVYDREYSEREKKNRAYLKYLEGKGDTLNMVLMIDFREYENLLDALIESAKEHFRRPEEEILWLINEYTGRQKKELE